MCYEKSSKMKKTGKTFIHSINPWSFEKLWVAVIPDPSLINLPIEWYIQKRRIFYVIQKRLHISALNSRKSLKNVILSYLCGTYYSESSSVFERDQETKIVLMWLVCLDLKMASWKIATNPKIYSLEFFLKIREMTSQVCLWRVYIFTSTENYDPLF